MDEHQRSFEDDDGDEEFDEQEEGEEEEEEEEGEDEDEDVVQRQASELQSWRIETQEKELRSETLVLSEVPVVYTLQPLDSSAKLKDQVGVSVIRHEASISVTGQGAQTQAQTQKQIQSTGCLTSLDQSPVCVAQTISSAPNPTLWGLSPIANGNVKCMSEMDKQNSSDTKTLSVAHIVKTPSTDGYNWRKYGQKQVKSPQGSRSYYKCTYSECYAKKIECCDHSNCVIEIIYKSQHNHDPPRKINSPRESRGSSSVAPVVVTNNTTHPIRAHGDSDPSTSSKEPVLEMLPTHETKQQDSSGSHGNPEINVKEEHADEPEPKRRLKKSSSLSSDSLVKPGKKPKFVVHAAGDVGISGDGYRWRKYGQKMVKGNPHPRNYYRCTSAGCPVRKHIERAVDNTSAVVITYKGVHDHDMPVPKKRHGQPSAPLVAAAAPASMNNLQFKNTESLENQVSATKWSVGTEGELTGEALETGGGKAIESARTLLSIGFEIKPC